MPPADFQTLLGKRFNDPRLIPTSIPLRSPKLRPIARHGPWRDQEEVQSQRHECLEKESHKTRLRHARSSAYHLARQLQASAFALFAPTQDAELEAHPLPFQKPVTSVTPVTKGALPVLVDSR